MSTDTIDRAVLEKASRAFIDSLRSEPFGRGESMFLTPDTDARRMHRDDLVAELRDSGLRTLARKVERTVIATGCLLVLFVDSEAKLQVIRIFGADE